MCDKDKAHASASAKSDRPVESVSPPCETATAKPKPVCTITSSTVATSPANRSRLKVGVGEEVVLTNSPGAASWTKTGGGTLSPASGTSTTFTAGETAGSVTITATGGGCSCTITFTVVEPSHWTMIQMPGTGIRHNRNVPGCGWLGKTHVKPVDVNFYRVETREVDSKYVGIGSLSSFNGVVHGNYEKEDDYASEWFVLNRHEPVDGSTDGSQDTIDTADYDPAQVGAAPPFKVGSGYFPITCQWRVLASTSIRDFPVTNQADGLNAAGLVHNSKGGTTILSKWDDPTTTFR